MNTNLKSGTCPKCNSTDVYTNKGNVRSGDRMNLVIFGLTRYYLDTYVCCTCSYFEEHINEDEFKNPKVMKEIKETWNKVNGGV